MLDCFSAGKFIEKISMEALRKRQAEKRAKRVEKVNNELRSKGIEVIVVPPLQTEAQNLKKTE
jgi:hypothetical protein